MGGLLKTAPHMLDEGFHIQNLAIVLVLMDISQ